MTDDLAGMIEPVARRLLGEPNRALSTRHQLRYGSRGSLAIEIAGEKAGAWCDHESGAGGGVLDLIARERRCDRRAAAEWLRAECGASADAPERSQGRREVATYSYHDESGATLFEVVRFEPKDFRQRRPDGAGGHVWAVRGVRQIPYRLPELIEDVARGGPVFIVEGEKDVDALRRLGVSATCNAGGAGKWRVSLAAHFSGADVVILPDNDDPGRAHAQAVARSLHEAAARVRILELPGLPPKGDVSDWIVAGGTAGKLVELADAVPDWVPPAAAGAKNGEQPVDAVDPKAPLATARQFRAARFEADGLPTLLHWRGDFRRWRDGAWPVAEEASLRASVYEFLDGAATSDGKPVPPTAASVSDVLDALRAAVHLSADVEPPAWLDSPPDVPGAGDLLPVANGLLDPVGGELWPHSPDFFTLGALPVPYVPDARAPDEWQRFLDSLWPEDQEAREALQEWFGYALTGDTSQQKIALMVGPKRAGKGTIARVLAGLLGAGNVAAPTLGELGMNFGLAPLIGRRLAIVSDARLGGRADQAAIAERLLSISGEDMLTIDRKFREPWTGRLGTRFMVMTNELPRLGDASGALASRLLVFMLERSFYGREDIHLTERLLAELPGILNWALEGLARLRGRGHFRQPATSAEAIRALEDLGAPVAAFVRDRCIIAAGREVGTKRLFDAWRTWCEEHGRRRPGSEQVFGRDLKAAFPGIHTAARQCGTDRWRVYLGIDLDGFNL